MPRLQTIKQRTAPATWLLATLLVCAPLGSHAAASVLCVGSDGHIATEPADGTACVDAHENAPAASGSTAESDAADPAHCGICTDIPIPTGGDADCASFKTERGPSAQTVLPVAALLPSLDRLPMPAPWASPSQDGRGALPSDPALSRSVVLLV